MENRIIRKKRVFSAFLILAVLLCILQSDGYCKKQETKKETKKDEKKAEAAQPVQLDKTIGDLAEVIAFNPIPVKGVGLVVGLPNTGSSECPPKIRDYLRQYIVTQVGSKGAVNPDAMIDSLDTAVVSVEGFIPPGASKYQPFDITVKAIPNTQTTSLAGGRLYTSELKFVARIEETIETSKTLALAAGPVYIDSITAKSDPRTGIVLGGGKSMQDYQVTLAFYKSDFAAAACSGERRKESSKSSCE
jgi:flagellar basal body P-ring protein FlgI